MTWLLATLLLLGQSAGPVGPATILATVDHSEWCPAGNVQLDLATGAYAFTATAGRPACLDPRLVRPVRRGRLAATDLAKIRLAYARAQSEGLDRCQEGKPEDIVISNGGTPVLVLTSGARTIAAPDAYSCWSEAAFALHDALEAPFEAGRRR